MADMSKPLSGKVAIVTGAGRGIGRAIANAYGEAGASVCCAARTLSEIQKAAEDIRGGGSSALAVATDVTDLSSVQAMVDQTVDAFGGLDILVINAGSIHARGPVADTDPEGWKATIDLNLVGAYYCARAAIPAMKARGAGKIITIGSGVGHRGGPGTSAYACSKAALWMLTRVLAQELLEDKISVNELVPGPVVTALNTRSEALRAKGDLSGEWHKYPDEVAPLALFLATQPDIGPTAQSFSLMRRDT